MKIKLDKETITLAEVQRAKEFAAENDWIDVPVIEEVVRGNVGGDRVPSVQIIGKPELKVAKNDFRLTIWVDCWAEFSRFESDATERYVAKVNADVLKWMNSKEKAAFIVEYKETRDYITRGKQEG